MAPQVVLGVRAEARYPVVAADHADWLTATPMPSRRTVATFLSVKPRSIYQDPTG